MQSHVLLAENEELLSLAAKAGCIGVFVGVESVSAAALSEANKGFNRVDRLKDNIARFHDHVIMVDGGIIFGFDTDTPDVFDRTIEAMKKVSIDSVVVNEIYTNKEGQKVKKVHWFKVTAFKRLAEIVGEYCAKCSRIGVRGQLQYRQWQDDEGGNHSIVEIRARELELLSGKNGKPAATEEETQPAATEDDEIPF